MYSRRAACCFLTLLASGCGWGEPVDADRDGYTARDCDDADPTVNPGTDEVCGNGKDDDCDGALTSCLEGEHALDDADAIIVSASYGSGKHNMVRFAGDLNGDRYDDVAVSEPGAGDGGGSVHIFLGGSTLPASLDDATASIAGDSAQDRGFGFDLAGVGDQDGDGLADLAAIAADAGEAPRQTISVYLIGVDDVAAGGASTSADLVLAIQGWWIDGVAMGPQDLTGDGEPDLLLAGMADVPDPTYGEATKPTAWICAGPVSSVRDVDDCDARVVDQNAWLSGIGFSERIDLNGDGADDLLATIPYSVDFPVDNTGAVIAIDGPLSGDYLADDADHLLLGAGGVTALGDLDGDGYDDFATNDETGLLIVHGPLAAGHTSPGSAAVATLTTGMGAIKAGDVYGDGTLSVIGQGPTTGSYPAYESNFYVLPADLSGTVTLEATWRTRFICDGSCGEDLTRGKSLAGGGDLNGDGLADILLATTGYTVGDGSQTYVNYGSTM